MMRPHCSITYVLHELDCSQFVSYREVRSQIFDLQTLIEKHMSYQVVHEIVLQLKYGGTAAGVKP
jgi:hypothetical protein